MPKQVENEVKKKDFELTEVIETSSVTNTPVDMKGTLRCLIERQDEPKEVRKEVS